MGIFLLVLGRSAIYQAAFVATGDVAARLAPLLAQTLDRAKVVWM